MENSVVTDEPYQFATLLSPFHSQAANLPCKEANRLVNVKPSVIEVRN